jgi:response regulator RpfG family c-di-GMP phosphodiesterase
MERRQIKWTERERGLVGKLEAHIRHVAEKNTAYLNQHVTRTARLSAAMAVHQGMPERDCFVSAEFGLKHDLGKNDAEAKHWIEKYRGQKVSEQERVRFRVYHCVMGTSFVRKLDRTDAKTTVEQDELVCLYHHEPYYRLNGEFKQHISIVQAADSLDAMMSTDDEHSFARFAEADAIRVLISRTSLGELDPAAMESLVFCRGLSYGSCAC